MNIEKSINDSFTNAINIMLSEINLSEEDNESSSDDDYIYENNDIFLDEEINDYLKNKKTLNIKNIKYLNQLNIKKEIFCSITQEKFKGPAIKLPCKHIFKKCEIINYLLKYNNKCPICRGEITIQQIKEVFEKKKKVLKALLKKKRNDLKKINRDKKLKKKKKFNQKKY
jgi:hypothetical protein